MENIKKFYDALSNDKALQERANALVKRDDKPDETTPPFGHPSKEGKDKAAVVAFANAEGYDFSLAELEACAQPLADDVMDAVAGGIFVRKPGDGVVKYTPAAPVSTPLPVGPRPPGSDQDGGTVGDGETGPDGIFI